MHKRMAGKERPRLASAQGIPGPAGARPPRQHARHRRRRLVPLAAMIGSGVDMSRAYMAKTRLQSACDAAALAGRRVMVDDTLDTNVTNEATRFFHFNFRKRPQRHRRVHAGRDPAGRRDGARHRVDDDPDLGHADVRLHHLPLNVTCDASLNFVNTDVMLVLDVTGSMDAGRQRHRRRSQAAARRGDGAL